MRIAVVALLLVCAILPCGRRPAQAADSPGIQNRFLLTSDHVRLHYIEAGSAAAATIVFVPGWTMPAWIWMPQIRFFAREYHVIAFDPRGQGESEIAPTGYDQDRRGADIAELVARTSGAPVLLVGWSLGVLDALAYVHEHGGSRIAGLVLIDNSVGENPPPSPPHPLPHARKRLPRAVQMRAFVHGLFRRSQPAAYLDALTDAALRTPAEAAAELLAYPVPRSYWREAIYSIAKPVLYVVRPHLAGQAANLAAHDPNAETAVFTDAGHALFIDDAARFNLLMLDFIHRRVWPAKS